MLTQEFIEKLQQIYQDTLKNEPEEIIAAISMQGFCNQFEEFPNWCIGPIKKDDSLTFKKPKQWNDPTGIGWESGFLFNPSTIVHDSKLYMFYRAAPKKESLSSRIGLSIYSVEDGWVDYSGNPIIFPQTDDEVVSTEDPKIYRLEDGYILFYNGIGEVTPDKKLLPINANGDFPFYTVTIKAAVTKDLLHFEPIGQIVPNEVSGYWAKGAVIPRDLDGNPVKINGQYLMFISEGCGGKQTVGFSNDMLHWEFKHQSYLDIGDMGDICEVACAVVNYCEDKNAMLLDFFYCKPDSTYSAAQALYNINEPFTQLAINKGGTLCWGGLTRFNGSISYGQGWDAKSGDEEMFFYTAPIQGRAF